MTLKSDQDFEGMVRSFINAFWATTEQKSLMYTFDATEYDESRSNSFTGGIGNRSMSASSN